MNAPAPDAAPTPAQRIARVMLIVALTLLGLWTLQSFLPALIWAAIFAIALWPLYRRARAHFPPGRHLSERPDHHPSGHPSGYPSGHSSEHPNGPPGGHPKGHNVLLPALFTLGVALVFLLPLALVIVPLSSDAHSVFVWVQQARQTGIPPPDFLSHLPAGRAQAQAWWQGNLGSPEAASDLLHRLAQADLFARSREYGSEIAHRAVLFGFTLLTLFFLFRDGDALVAQMHRAGRRLFGPNGEELGEQMVASVHGTVDGLVLVGLAEGILLGIFYAFAGVPHPSLFGLLTALAAMVPFGAVVLVLIAAALLLVQGAKLAAIGVVVFGMIVNFVADHFARPALIGGSTRLPFIWVLLGILGGLETWGLLGLFVGPALMAALMLLWREGTAGRGDAAESGTQPPAVG